MLETTFSSTGESVATHDDRRGLVEQRDRAVLHLAGGVGVGGDVGDLLQLQRPLERDGQADVAADVEEELALPAATRRSRAPARLAARRAPRRCSAAAASSRRPARAGAGVERRRAARPGAARAGTCTATWQTNVLVAATPISSPARVNSTPSASRVACEPITFVIASTRRPALARQAHRRERVGGLARLRDADHEVAGADDGVAVAVLGGDVHLHRQARPLLDRVAADQPGVVGGAAGDDHDPRDVGEQRLVDRALLGEVDAVRRARCGRRSPPRPRRPVRGSP